MAGLFFGRNNTATCVLALKLPTCSYLTTQFDVRLLKLNRKEAP